MANDTALKYLNENTWSYPCRGPHACTDNRPRDGGEVSFTHQPATFLPQEDSWYSFLMSNGNVSNSATSNCQMLLKVNWKTCRRKESWRNLGYYSIISPKGLSRTTRNVSPWLRRRMVLSEVEASLFPTTLFTLPLEQMWLQVDPASNRNEYQEHSQPPGLYSLLEE
jgi:hypothetical protein